MSDRKVHRHRWWWLLSSRGSHRDCLEEPWRRSVVLLLFGMMPFAGSSTVVTPESVLMEEYELFASDGDGFDFFGTAVALSEDLAVVGAPLADDPANSAGSAYVFQMDETGVWMEVSKLIASDGAGSDEFGQAVAVSGDIVIVGAPLDDDAGFNSGSAYVFERDETGSWVEVAKLVASDGAANANFAEAVALQGTLAVVGGEDFGGLGSAYVFERFENGTWVERAKLVASDQAPGDAFGFSVALSEPTIVVGAFRDDDAGSSTGSAYVFERDQMGQWIQAAKLLASDASAGSSFGRSVGVSGDLLVVGAFDEDDLAFAAGAAYVFERGDTGAWGEVAKITASDGASEDHFGWSVALSNSHAIIGAPDNDDPQVDSGSAYFFERDDPGGWVEVAKLGPSDGGLSNGFGESVQVSAGRTVIGAPLADGRVGNSGSAYVFTLSHSIGGTGLCLEAVNSCNDYYLELEPEGSGLFRLQGYEYGCRRDSRLVDGTLRRVGDTLYLGLTASNGQDSGDGRLAGRNYVIDFVTQEGTYEFVYSYSEGGVLQGVGGSGSAALSRCSDPGESPQSIGRDEMSRQ